ncbi:Ldh family oxidoreductase [Sphingosinicella rhizophila]|uniref:Ldh family oxidoreductase n=1 Tax=Sphingosinicella rhizophila TaxID=3050082 RepID=A0ABU3QB89_9SPHN|nr:Ldh family oxidoreductase [Sphingosinicella sp. GR2756]MDT9600220.1 Ldh family oxidoreductase [Sphingosinicella sp. GR2756]
MTTVGLTLEQVEELATRAFSQNGCDAENTAALVRTVVGAERDGSHSHGLFRVPGYVAALRSGKVNGSANPRVSLKTPAIVSVHGDNGFTPLAIERGVPALAEAAKTLGVAVMATTHTHHFAALWPETEMIAEQGLIGMACVCYMPYMAPAGGNKALFGTNPLSFAWPRPGKPPMAFDMATAAMAMGEVQIAARDGHKVPIGTGLDAEGRLTDDPGAIASGMLLPFGGHKGSAIALMVELLAAGAVGEQFSFEAGETDNKDGGPPRGGEFMLAISPELLAGPGWAEHCEAFFERFDAIEGARLPGARRHENRLSDAPRQINADLVERIRALCD